jgi:hypothetical protein
MNDNPCSEATAAASTSSLQSQQHASPLGDDTVVTAVGVPLLLPQESNADGVNSLAPVHLTNGGGPPEMGAPASLDAVPAPDPSPATRRFATGDTVMASNSSSVLVSCSENCTPAAAENLPSAGGPLSERPDSNVPEVQSTRSAPHGKTRDPGLDSALGGWQAGSSGASTGKRMRKPSTKAILGEGVTNDDLKNNEAAASSDQRKACRSGQPVVVTSSTTGQSVTLLPGKSNRVWHNKAWHRRTAEGELVRQVKLGGIRAKERQVRGGELSPKAAAASRRVLCRAAASRSSLPPSSTAAALAPRDSSRYAVRPASVIQKTPIVLVAGVMLRTFDS